MKIFTTILLCIIGLIIGYKIPDLSFQIMEYKKGIRNMDKANKFMYSKCCKLMFSIFSGGVCVLVVLNVVNPFVVFLISVQIIVGLIIMFIDINIRIIPNELVLTLVVTGIIFQLVSYGFKSFLIAIICMFVMMFVFTSVAAFVGFGKVGAGDVKLAGAMGLALGYPLIINAVGIMAIVLLFFIIIGMALKKIYLSTMLPLAPFLISGYVVALILMIMNVDFLI